MAATRLPAMQALRALEATARLGSLTRAADELSLTHGAISHQLKALEADLGVDLVERAGRGVRMTEAGEHFAARVRAALADLGAAVREVAGRANPRRLKVSTTPSFASRWLLPRIGRFTAAHPEFDLDVSANSAYVDFRRDDDDVAIRHGLGHWPGVEVEFLHGDTFFPVASPRLDGGRLPARPADLARHTLLRAEGEPWRPWFDAAGLDWPEPERGPSFSDSSHLMQAAADGQGVALARSSLIGNDVRNGVLVRLFDIEVPSLRGYYLVYPPGNSSTPKIAALRAWLHEEFARDDAVSAASASARRAPSRPRPPSRSPRRRGA